MNINNKKWFIEYKINKWILMRYLFIRYKTNKWI